MKLLEIKVKQTKGSKFNYLKFLDSEGYEVHRIVMSFNKKSSPGHDNKWFHKDAYVDRNRLWITKYNGKEERKVSYPIKKDNKYYIKKEKK